jgi:hypothetical protein
MKEYTLENIETSIEDAKKVVILHEGKKYTYFDEGSTRFVYVSEDEKYVIKVEKFRLGKFNQEEQSVYDNASEEDKKFLVETTLLQRGHIFQRYVTPIKFGGKKLSKEQKAFADSCRGEVGWDSKGNLLCFDLSEYKKY